jgi:hypothetical protein
MSSQARLVSPSPILGKPCCLHAALDQGQLPGDRPIGSAKEQATSGQSVQTRTAAGWRASQMTARWLAEEPRQTRRTLASGRQVGLAHPGRPDSPPAPNARMPRRRPCGRSVNQQRRGVRAMAAAGQPAG